MKKIITILSLLLFMLTPMASGQNSAVAESTLAHAMLCSEGMDCATAPQSCCAASFTSSFILVRQTQLVDFIIAQRVAYINYQQLPLLGTYKVVYRPPIV